MKTMIVKNTIALLLVSALLMLMVNTAPAVSLQTDDPNEPDAEAYKIGCLADDANEPDCESTPFGIPALWFSADANQPDYENAKTGSPIYLSDANEPDAEAHLRY